MDLALGEGFPFRQETEIKKCGIAVADTLFAIKFVN